VKENRRGDPHRLADILVAIAKIREFTRPGLEAFLASEVTQDAVIRNFEVIGEAAGKVSPRLRSGHPQVPWSKMRGLAALAKHEYWKVDPHRLWAAVEALPAIEASVSKIRAEGLEK
jgi:uncharacterized protein with HEPN domain